MTRSLNKGPYIHHSLLEKVKSVLRKANQEGSLVSKYIIYTDKRSSTILDIMVGMNINLHNGFRYHKVYIREDMIGRKLGEALVTRKFTGHTSKTKSATQATKAKKR